VLQMPDCAFNRQPPLTPGETNVDVSPLVLSLLSARGVAPNLAVFIMLFSKRVSKQVLRIY